MLRLIARNEALEKVVEAARNHLQWCKDGHVLPIARALRELDKVPHD
jgi:hypothetical protein